MGGCVCVYWRRGGKPNVLALEKLQVKVAHVNAAVEHEAMGSPHFNNDVQSFSTSDAFAAFFASLHPY